MTNQPGDELSQKRLKILDKGEIEDLYGRPRFTEDERALHFSLTPAEQAAIENLHRRSRLYCILEMGYFKSRHQFFIFHLDDVQEDRVHLLFPGSATRSRLHICHTVEERDPIFCYRYPTKTWGKEQFILAIALGTM